MIALTPKRLFLSLSASLRPYTFFSRSPLVFETLLEEDKLTKLLHGLSFEKVTAVI